MSNVCFKWLVYTRIIPNTYVLGPVWPYPEGIWHDWQGLRMNDVPRTHGLWAASSPPGPAAPPLAGEVVADVAIVGGGFTGCSAAYHLARAGQVPVLIEAERVGRSEEHTSELQSLMRISYAVFRLKKKTERYSSTDV